MRVASYNHMFGCDGRSLLETAYVHGWHELRRYGPVEKRASINNTMDTIMQIDPEVVGICEVLGERQRWLLMGALGEEGFSGFHEGKGHGLNPAYGFVETLLASRAPSESIYKPEFNVPDELGNGGGIVEMHLPDYGLYVIQVHLPHFRGKKLEYFHMQISDILKKVEEIQKSGSSPKIIVMGDFNCEYEKLVGLYPALAMFDRLSADVSTCSMTNFLRWMYRKDLDHVLGLGVNAKDSGVIEGMSDHKLVWVDIGF